MVLVLDIVLDIYVTARASRKCAIFTDNQAAIQAIQNPKQPSGRYILVEAIQALDGLRVRGWIVEFRWIPSHVGVPGNEAADRAAKIAAGYDPGTRTVLGPPTEPEPPTLIATPKTTIRKTMESEWAYPGRRLSTAGISSDLASG